jgi:hypothetical protein
MRVSFGAATKDNDGHWVVAVQRMHDDGTMDEGVHVFPDETLEWRAAEFGVSPDDRDTLLDIVLTEPYLTAEDWNQGSQLHDAASITEAREHHLARVARAKLRHRMTTRGKAHPLERVRREAAMHPEALQLKRELVRRGRENHREARARDADTSRIDALRHRLQEK